MRHVSKEAYKSSIKTADRVLAADKLILADLRHDEVEGVYYDADIMAGLLLKWLAQLEEYRLKTEGMLKEVYDDIEATVPESKVHASHAFRRTRVH